MILKDEHTRSYPTMYARIWMLKCILSIYDGAFRLLNLKSLEYVWTIKQAVGVWQNVKHFSD